MKIRTKVKAGGIKNHNQTCGLKVKTNVKAGIRPGTEGGGGGTT